jgi:hypothetical protein
MPVWSGAGASPGDDDALKILAASNLHLGARLLAWGDEAATVRPLLEAAWDEVLRLILDPKEDLDALLVAGDLFDEPEPSPELQARVFEGLERLAAAGKAAVLVPGIYDAVTSPRSLYLRRPWPRGIHPVTWTAPRSLPIAGAEETLDVVSAIAVPGAGFPDLASLSPRSGRRVGLFPAGGKPPSILSTWAPDADREAAGDWDLDLLILGGGGEPTEEAWGSTRVLRPGSPVPLTPDASRDRGWSLITLAGGGIEIETRPRELPPLPPRPQPAPRSEPAADDGSRAGVRGAFVDALVSRRRRAGSDAERDLLDRALAEGLKGFERAEAAHVD